MLIEVLADGSPVLPAAELLALAEAEGKHLLCVADLTQLEALINLDGLSRRQRAAWERVRAERAERGALPSRARRVLQISWDPKLPPLPWVESTGRVGWRLPAQRLTDSLQVQRCLLAGESERDIRLIQALARWWRSPSDRAQLAFDGLPSGGNNFPSQLAEPLQQGRPLFAVVDSDRSAADGPEGSTARGARRAFEAATAPGPRELHVLGARELENLIPAPLWALLPPLQRPSTPGHLYSNLKVGKESLRHLAEALDNRGRGERPSHSTPIDPALTELLTLVLEWGRAEPVLRS